MVNDYFEDGDIELPKSSGLRLQTNNWECGAIACPRGYQKSSYIGSKNCIILE